MTHSRRLIPVLGVLLIAFSGFAQGPGPSGTKSIPTKSLSEYAGKLPAAQSPQIQIRLSADNVNPVAGQNVHFTVTGTERFKGLQYDFDWGDFQKVSSAQPAGDHAYSQPGSYSAQVTVRLAAAVARIAIPGNQLTITVQQPRVPSTLELRANPASAPPGEPIKFTATLTPPDASAKYHFIFGDETEEDSANREIGHAYKNARDYRPVVTAFIPGREETVSSKPVLVKIVPIVPAKLHVTVLPERPISGQDFVMVAQMDPASRNDTFHFDWGDGSSFSSFGMNVRATHAFQIDGEHTVIVTASERGADLNPQRKKITVVVVPSTPPPPAPRWPWWLLGGLAAVAAVLVLRRLLRLPVPQGLHFKPGAGPAEHRMSGIRPSGPHISVTLKPGMDPGSDRMIFSEGPAPDQEEHHAR